MIAGAFVLLSLALGYWVSLYWYLFTTFVGLNLLQSAFTNWCPDDDYSWQVRRPRQLRLYSHWLGHVKTGVSAP